MKISLQEKYNNIFLEYLSLLIVEFEKVAYRYGSEYFRRIEEDMRGYGNPRHPTNTSTLRIIKAEKNLDAVMEKLHIDEKIHPVHLVYEFVEAMQGSPEKFTGGDKSLSKKMIKKLTQLAIDFDQSGIHHIQNT